MDSEKINVIIDHQLLMIMTFAKRWSSCRGSSDGLNVAFELFSRYIANTVEANKYIADNDIVNRGLLAKLNSDLQCMKMLDKMDPAQEGNRVRRDIEDFYQHAIERVSVSIMDDEKTDTNKTGK